MKTWFKFCLLLLIFVGLSCSKKDAYVGGFYDFNTLEPIHKLVECGGDHFNIYNRNMELLERISIEADSIEWKRSDTFFHVCDYRDKINNKLLISKYIKCVQSPLTSKSLGHRLLKNKIWETTSDDLIINRDFTIKTFLIFKSDRELVQQRHYIYDGVLIYHENESLEYSLVEFGGSTILYIFNSATHQKFPALQLKHDNKASLVFMSAREIDLTYDTLTVSSSDEILAQNLNDISYHSYKENKEYYFGRANYPEGSQGVLKMIEERRLMDSNKSSGYAIFNFTINYKNKIGRFGLELMDLDFKPMRFDSEFVKGMFEIIKACNWQINKDHDHIQTNDEVHAFLMLKIKDGKIIDVVP